MQIVARLVKGVLGGFIIALACAILMLPVLSALGITAREDLGIGIGMAVSFIGGILGGIVLSKEKWWMILVVLVVTFAIASFFIEKFPNGYA